MELYTTLRLLREHRACGAPGSTDGKQYPLLVEALGPGWGDDDPILLVRLLDLDTGRRGWTGALNSVWALRAVPNDQAEARDRLATALCVEVLGRIPGPPEHHAAVSVLHRYSYGRATLAEVQAASRGAWDAAAAWDAWATRSAWEDWVNDDTRATRWLRGLLEMEVEGC